MADRKREDKPWKWSSN